MGPSPKEQAPHQWHSGFRANYSPLKSICGKVAGDWQTGNPHSPPIIQQRQKALQPTQETHPTPHNPPSLRLLASIARGKGLLGDIMAHPSPPNQKEVDQTKPG